MKLKLKWFKFLLLYSSLFLIGCSQKQEPIFTIAASSNLHYCINELANSFQKDTGIPMQITLGASSKLSFQIINGAYFDIFLSADSIYPSQIKRKLKLKNPPVTYAYGKIAVASNKNINDNFLISSKKIGIPNPLTTPYGKEILNYLNSLKNFPDIKHKIVYGESVMHTNTLLKTKAVDIIFTSLSSINNEKEIYYTNLPLNKYSLLNQQLIIVNDDSISHKFANYILSTQGKAILKQHEYTIPQ